MSFHLGLECALLEVSRSFRCPSSAVTVNAQFYTFGQLLCSLQASFSTVDVQMSLRDELKSFALRKESEFAEPYKMIIFMVLN